MRIVDKRKIDEDLKGNCGGTAELVLATGARQTVLEGKFDSGVKGQPICISLARQPVTDSYVAEVYASVKFGEDGAAQEFLVDWVNGRQFWVPGGYVRVDIYCRNLFSGGGTIRASALAVAKEGGGSARLPTMTEHFGVVTNGADTDIVPIPMFAVKLAQIIKGNNISGSVRCQQLSPDGTTAARVDFSTTLLDYGWPVSGLSTDYRMRNNTGVDALLAAVWEIGVG